MATEQMKSAADALEQLVSEGMQELENQNFARAVSLFRRALQLAPLRYDLRQYLAAALERDIAKKPSAAEEIQLEIDPPAATRLFRSDRETEAKERQTHSMIRLPFWLVGLTCVGCIVIVGALWAFNRNQDALTGLIRRVQNLGAPEHVVQAREYYQKAEEKFAAEEYENAITFLQEARQTNPQEAEEFQGLLIRSYLMLGEEQLNGKKWQAALEYFTKAADADPGQLAPWFNLGYCNYQLARKAQRDRKSGEKFYREAEKALQRALEIEPQHWESLVLLAETYPKLNQLQKACDVWYQLIEIKPESSEAKKAVVSIRNYGLDPRKKRNS